MNWKICAILSALFASLTAIFGKLGVKDIDSNLATAIRVSVILVFAWGIAACTGVSGQVRHLAAKTWLFLSLSGIATGLSWLFFFRALQLGDALVKVLYAANDKAVQLVFFKILVRKVGKEFLRGGRKNAGHGLFGLANALRG